MIRGQLKKLIRTIIGVPIIVSVWLITLSLSLFIYIVAAPIEWIFTGEINNNFFDWVDESTSPSPYSFIKDIWSK